MKHTDGRRVASKLLVQVPGVLALLCIGHGAALAQPAEAAPFEILDNSFLVEEAFNQERGIFQNIVGAVRTESRWDVAFTQEWPVGSEKHQVSYTIPFGGLGGRRGMGDVQIHYRHQAWAEGPSRPAFSPRLSLIVPSGSVAKGLGQGSIGWQVNLPFSKQRNDFYVHWNGGGTYLAGVDSGGPAAEKVALFTPHVSASGIWRVRPMLNLLVEGVLQAAEDVDTPGTTRRAAVFTLSPGVRGGWNLGDHQLIVGLAAPVTWTRGSAEAGVFGYCSYELPFEF